MEKRMRYFLAFLLTSSVYAQIAISGGASLSGAASLFQSTASGAGRPFTQTVCALSCDTTSIQTAVNTVIANMNGDCTHPGIVSIRAGETFSPANTITLAAKSCAQLLIVETDAYRSLPNRRITPADASLMPTIRIPNDGLGFTVGCYYPGSVTGCDSTTRVSNIVFRGLIVKAYTNAWPNYVGIQTGLHAPIVDGGYKLAQRWEWLPQNITVDRCYFYGDDGILLQSGVQSNGTNIVIRDSYFNNVIWDNDSQCIAGPAQQGSLFLNNYLMCSGESILIGGATLGGSYVTGVVGGRNSMFYRGNYSYKNPYLYLQSGAVNPSVTPCYNGSYYQNTMSSAWFICASAGTVWNASSAPPFLPGQPLTKNHFELKDGQAVYVGNLLVGGWVQAQQGQCFHVAVSSKLNANFEAGYTAWGNKCDGTGGFATQAFGGVANWGWYANTIIHDNMAIHMWNVASGGGDAARLSLSVGPFRSLSFYNNTIHADNPGPFGVVPDDNDTKATAVLIVDNAINETLGGDYANLFRSGVGGGWCTGYLEIEPGDQTGNFNITHNAVAGTRTKNNACGWPPPTVPRYEWPTNTVGAADNNALWTNFSGGDWTIKSSLTAAINTAANGKNIGADIAMVAALTANVATGSVNPPPFWVNTPVRASSSSAKVYFTASSTNACTVIASLTPDFAVTTGSIAQSRTGLGGVATITGLSTGPINIRVTCDSAFLDGKVVITP